MSSTSVPGPSHPDFLQYDQLTHCKKHSPNPLSYQDTTDVSAEFVSSSCLAVQMASSPAGGARAPPEPPMVRLHPYRTSDPSLTVAAGVRSRMRLLQWRRVKCEYSDFWLRWRKINHFERIQWSKVYENNWAMYNITKHCILWFLLVDI